MKCIKLNAGEARGMAMSEMAEPVIDARRALVRVRAASLNFRDGLIASGHYPGVFRQGIVPLSDGAGEVVAVGDEVTRFKAGDRVAIACMPRWVAGPFEPRYAHEQFGVTIDGMLAEYVAVDEEGLVALPETLTFEDGASLPCAAVTAWNTLSALRPLIPGQTVLTLGTGSVSLFALQFAKLHGARVISTTSSEAKADKLKALGADHVINYRSTPDWEKSVMELTNGEGVDCVVEVGGGNTLVKSIAATRPGGQIGMIGFVAGFGGDVDPLSLIGNGVMLRGIGMGNRLELAALIKAMAYHRTHAVIDRVYPFADFGAAFASLHDAERFGKSIISIE
jgi:NADPH:quinone reductase-like Zn-dependent oxidoreductase